MNESTDFSKIAKTLSKKFKIFDKRQLILIIKVIFPENLQR